MRVSMGYGHAQKNAIKARTILAIRRSARLGKPMVGASREVRPLRRREILSSLIEFVRFDCRSIAASQVLSDRYPSAELECKKAAAEAGEGCRGRGRRRPATAGTTSRRPHGLRHRGSSRG
jgi:N-methylhydantoinase A/oxoprolinase/acetone carboxylase beta subunit